MAAASKIYDGTVSASFSGGVLSGVLGDDEVSLVMGSASLLMRLLVSIMLPFY